MRKSVHSSAEIAFRELMADARHKAGLSQYDVAHKLKKPQSFVAKYEKGERRIDVIEFISIARALNADPVRLLKALSRQIR
jgi:transcriptional regulator with XRE-family HTH domain